MLGFLVWMYDRAFAISKYIESLDRAFRKAIKEVESVKRFLLTDATEPFLAETNQHV